MVQTQRLSEQQETTEAAEEHVQKLLRCNEGLEDKMAAQCHTLALEQAKTLEGNKELEQQRDQLMQDLEMEKLKVEEDIKQLLLNKVRS